MIIKTADYTGSYAELNKCPAAALPEFAFIGRSNVGKSSLINYLCGRKALSKVSVTPGKTQTINFFLINKQFNLVDLPGYSYAKVSKERREVWGKMLRSYIINRKQLQYVFVLIDSRIKPQLVDLEFIAWLAQNNIPQCIIFTKADKPGKQDIVTNIQLFENALGQTWAELPPIFITSSAKKLGKEAVWEFIEAGVNYYRPHKPDLPPAG
jgi:GTP-binding protein